MVTYGRNTFIHVGKGSTGTELNAADIQTIFALGNPNLSVRAFGPNVTTSGAIDPGREGGEPG